MRRILSGCDQEVKDPDYRSLMRLKLEYGGSAWNPYTKKSIDQIEMVQRRSAHFVCNDSHDWAPWLGFCQTSRLFFRASMFYKILNGHVGICFHPEVCPIIRAIRLPNTRPFKQSSVSNNVFFLSKDDNNMEQFTSKWWREFIQI